VLLLLHVKRMFVEPDLTHDFPSLSVGALLELALRRLLGDLTTERVIQTHEVRERYFLR
jgi:hypothetical protein